MLKNNMIKVLAAVVLAFLTCVPSAGDAAPRRGGSARVPSETAMPPAPARPADSMYGESAVFYDIDTGLQMSYWREVMSAMLGDKLNRNADNIGVISDVTQLWQVVERDNIRFTDNEAKLLCLYVTNTSEEPDADLVPNWPSPGWPRCGNVLETMFGNGFHRFISDHADDPHRVEVYRALLMGMGINPKAIERTVNRHIQITAVGDGTVDLGSSTASAEEDCYTAATNIQVVDASECGILCTVTTIITGLLNAASEAIFSATVDNPTFTGAVQAAMALYVTIFGAMVVLGFTQLALGDALIRIAKLGVVTILITSSQSLLLFNLARCFFIEGATYLINAVLSIGLEAVHDLLTTSPSISLSTGVSTGAVSGLQICSSTVEDATSGGGPLVILETLLFMIFSNHMALTLLTLFISSPEGALLTVFLAFGGVMFILSIISAVTIYLTSLIALYLLLSMAPIFISFLLFEKTKDLFDGWLKLLAGNALTPVLLFAYISLFIVVLEAALSQILDTKICWRPWMTLAWVFELHKYQFVDLVTNVTILNTTPFGFFEVLILIILVMIMREFEESVPNIALHITNGISSAVNDRGRMQRWFRGKANQLGNAALSGAAKFGKQASSRKASSQVSQAHSIKRPDTYNVRSEPESYTTGGGTKVTDYRGAPRSSRPGNPVILDRPSGGPQPGGNRPSVAETPAVNPELKPGPKLEWPSSPGSGGGGGLIDPKTGKPFKR